MRLEIVVPQTAVNVSPGVETRVRIQVANRGDAAVPVRIGLARGRLSTWAEAQPSVVSAGPGESTGVDLVFRPPATATPASTLQPFTVQAEDMRDGSVAARATGLLAVAAPARLTAGLAVTRTRRRKVELRLTVTNASEAALTVRVRPSVESVGDGPDRGARDRAARKAARKAARRISTRPSVLDLPAGEDAHARIVARPRRAFIGARLPYVVSVRCLDAADDLAAEFPASGLGPSPFTSNGLTPAGLSASDPLTTGLTTSGLTTSGLTTSGLGASGVPAGLSGLAGDEPAPPLATVTHAGVARPRLARPTATIIGLLLVAALTGGAVVLGRDGGLPEQFKRLRPGGTQPAEDPVRLPYALVDVFVQTGQGGGKAVADATRERLNGAGMQVRVVDSTKSALLEDGATGFWVVLRDGFPSAEAVEAYCRQYRFVAPNCQVVT
jgi:hypothetical protein